MKTVGFIDYFLDEWHANKYPAMIKERTNGEFQVKYAYGKVDCEWGLTNEKWAEKHGIELLDSIEAVVEKSDVLVVLSPDNPEMHEELTDLPLKSGKLVYVDKTFATDKETALRIFENADKHNTKCFSSSALRFATELKAIDKKKIDKIYSEGAGYFDSYAIHLIEPIVMLMGSRAKRVMSLGNATHPSLVIEFEDGRYAQLRQILGAPFKITAVDDENKYEEFVIESDYFGLFVDAMVKFFETGEIPVEHAQTVDVIAIRESGLKAFETPFMWVEI